MLSFVLAIVVGVWFFFVARARGLNPFQWAAIGALVFGGSALLVGNLTFALASPIPAQDLAAVAIGALAGSFAVAIAATWFTYHKFLRKKADIGAE